MGCFLACFGFSKKRKRRKPGNKVLSADQGHGSYKPLDSDVTVNLDITEKPSKSDSEFSNKGKERSSSRIKKKVSFNLNVKAYEPLPNYDFTSYFSESEEEKCEENKEETTKTSNDSEASKMGSYPSNYRYQNCRDTYEEDDDIKLEESDLDEDDGDEEYDGDSDSGDDVKMSQEEFAEQFYSSSMESEKRVTSAQLANDKTSNLIPLAASLDQELKKLGLNHKAARDRSQYVFSVLNPVENLNQWKALKAAKAKAPPPLKQQRKENIELEQQKIPLCRKPIAVDASLSNWLVSSKTGSITTG